MVELFGPFELQRRLGSGGMAEVWRATYRADSGFAKEVAVKRILAGRLGDADIATSFEDEARLCSRLRHPGIVEVYDHGRIDGVPYLSMELIEGIGLDTVLWSCRRHATTLHHHAVLELGMQVCDALSYAHEALDDHGQPLGLVHRDLKPANIMVDRRGHVRLLDFGIAKATTNQFLTRTDVIRGTPCYLSPEACSNEPTTPRSDLFALAAILAEAIVGDRVFLEEENFATMQRIAAVDLRDTLDRVAAVSPSMAACLSHAFERDPDDRTPNARTFKHELLAAVRGPTGPNVLLGAVEGALDGHAPDTGRSPDPASEAPATEEVVEARVYLDEEIPDGMQAPVEPTRGASWPGLAQPAGLRELERRQEALAPQAAIAEPREGGLWFALIVLIVVNLALASAFFFDTPGELIGWLQGTTEPASLPRRTAGS